MKAILYEAFSAARPKAGQSARPHAGRHGVVVEVRATGGLQFGLAWLGRHEQRYHLAACARARACRCDLPQVGRDVTRCGVERAGDGTILRRSAGIAPKCHAGISRSADNQFQPGFTPLGIICGILSIHRKADRTLCSARGQSILPPRRKSGCRSSPRFSAPCDQGRVLAGKVAVCMAAAAYGLSGRSMIARGCRRASLWRWIYSPAALELDVRSVAAAVIKRPRSDDGAGCGARASPRAGRMCRLMRLGR